MKSLPIGLIVITVFAVSCGSGRRGQEKKNGGAKVTFTERTADQAVDVMVDGSLFTTFRWPDNVCKPVLYPVCAPSGTEITRGFPINPRTGERVDHPHQVGMWLTYGNVNGYDFWGNGSQGLGTKNENGGVIKHLKTQKMTGGVGEGSMVTEESWTDPSGQEHLKENTEYHFIAKDSIYLIDRITTLTAREAEVRMPDTKEGMFGIRVARQLELPSEGDITLYNAEGEPETVKGMTNEGISGNYRSSEGITGEAVWSTRARWMDLYGNIGNEKISLVICDHPKNPNYPTYWHARGYGLFSANPLGVKDFTQEKEELNFSIPAGGTVTFRYRVIISSGKHLNDEEINAIAGEFSGRY